MILEDLVSVTFFTLLFCLIDFFLCRNYILPIFICINFLTIIRIPDCSSFCFTWYDSVFSINNSTPMFTSSIILVWLRYTSWLLWICITFDYNIIISLMFSTTIRIITNVTYNLASNFSPTCVCNTTPWLNLTINLKSLRFKLNWRFLIFVSFL